MRDLLCGGKDCAVDTKLGDEFNRYWVREGVLVRSAEVWRGEHQNRAEQSADLVEKGEISRCDSWLRGWKGKEEENRTDAVLLGASRRADARHDSYLFAPLCHTHPPAIAHHVFF